MNIENTISESCGCCDSGVADDRRTARTEELKNSLLSRLNRVEGQIRGIKGMVERDAYCDDVLNQMAAAQSALNGAARLLLENHVRSCVAHKIQAGDEGIIDELMTTIGRML